MADEGPSLPSNYVTILHLKERWLKQQQQQSSKSNPIPHESDSVKPKHDSSSDSKIPNESVYPRTNRHRISNQHKHDVTPHDSTSKTPNDSVHRRKNHHQAINQPKPEDTVLDSASKTVVQVTDTHQTVEKQQKHNTDQSKSNPNTSKTKNSSKKRNPRFVTDQIPTGSNTTLTDPAPEPVPEKKQHRNKSRRRNKNREVPEPKNKTPPVAPKLDDSSHNDSGGDGVVDTVAAAVKKIYFTNVSQSTDRRWGSGRFNGGPRTKPANPAFGVKKEHTTTTVWVRKGESASN